MPTKTLNTCPACHADRDALASDLADPDVYEDIDDGDYPSKPRSFGRIRLRSDRHQEALGKIWKCPECKRHFGVGQ